MSVKIAIIEDNPDNLELMVYILEQYNYQVVTAFDGEEGIQLIEKTRPDLIMSDIQLPKLDGYQVAQYVKNNEALKNIPLIALTAYSMVGDREKILSSGFDYYISKPIDPEFFIRDIQHCIDRGVSKT